MALALTFGIAGWVLLLVAVGAYELLRQKRRKRSGTPLSATYLNEVTAMFYGTKRMELDHRNSWSMMRQEDEQGGPPRPRVDLDRGLVALPPAGPADPAATTATTPAGRTGCTPASPAPPAGCR